MYHDEVDLDCDCPFEYDVLSDALSGAFEDRCLNYHNVAAVYSHNPYGWCVLQASEKTKRSHRTSVHAPKPTRIVRHLHHRNAFHAPPREAEPLPHYEGHQLPAVLPALKPKSMCCYFKQKGFCKMGDKCWHGHEGDLYTPCHYGAECKAGHATLALLGGDRLENDFVAPQRPEIRRRRSNVNCKMFSPRH